MAFAHVWLILAPGPGDAGTFQSSIAAPANFTGTAVSDRSIQWSWDALIGSSTILGATHYELQEQTTNVPIAIIPGPGSTPVTFIETGLSPGTTYCRHVVAFNGPSSASTADVCITTTGGTVLPAPTNFAGVLIGDNVVRWSWDASAGADFYSLEDLAGSAIITVPSTGVSTITVFEGGLDPLTIYTREVKAIKGTSISHASNTDSVTTGQGEEGNPRRKCKLSLKMSKGDVKFAIDATGKIAIEVVGEGVDGEIDHCKLMVVSAEVTFGQFVKGLGAQPPDNLEFATTGPLAIPLNGQVEATFSTSPGKFSGKASTSVQEIQDALAPRLNDLKKKPMFAPVQILPNPNTYFAELTVKVRDQCGCADARGFGWSFVFTGGGAPPETGAVESCQLGLNLEKVTLTNTKGLIFELSGSVKWFPSGALMVGGEEFLNSVIGLVSARVRASFVDATSNPIKLPNGTLLGQLEFDFGNVSAFSGTASTLPLSTVTSDLADEVINKLAKVEIENNLGPGTLTNVAQVDVKSLLFSIRVKAFDLEPCSTQTQTPFASISK